MATFLKIHTVDGETASYKVKPNVPSTVEFIDGTQVLTIPLANGLPLSVPVSTIVSTSLETRRETPVRDGLVRTVQSCVERYNSAFLAFCEDFGIDGSSRDECEKRLHDTAEYAQQVRDAKNSLEAHDKALEKSRKAERKPKASAPTPAPKPPAKTKKKNS